MQDTNSNNPDQFIRTKKLLNSMLDSLRTPKWLEEPNMEKLSKGSTRPVLSS